MEPNIYIEFYPQMVFLFCHRIYAVTIGSDVQTTACSCSPRLFSVQLRDLRSLALGISPHLSRQGFQRDPEISAAAPETPEARSGPKRHTQIDTYK